MIYTVTFNPSIDYVVAIENFETGKINRTTSEALFAGGKGINVSYVLAQLGVKSTALGFIAGFTGIELQSRLREQGISTDFITVKEGLTRINVKMRSNAETEINGQGPVVSKGELAQLVEKINSLKDEDILVISGSVCKGVSQSIYADVVKLCNEKRVRVIVDASSQLLWNTLEYNPFLIKPNHHELGEIFNQEISTREEMIFYAKELQNRGARNVLVSAGEMGAILVAEDNKVYEQKAPIGNVVNSVGAGDSMVAGFLAGYLKSNSFEEALKLGVSAGSATAFLEGLADKKKIEEVFTAI